MKTSATTKRGAGIFGIKIEVVPNRRWQFMMAEKARMFGDSQMLARIMEASHPKEMKAYGRAVQGFDETAWNGACYGIVKRGNRHGKSQSGCPVSVKMERDKFIRLCVDPGKR